MSLTDLEGSAVASRLPVTQRYSHRLSTPEVRVRAALPSASPQLMRQGRCRVGNTGRSWGCAWRLRDWELSKCSACTSITGSTDPARSRTHAPRVHVLHTILTVMMVTNKRESRRVAQVESLVAYIDASCGPLRVLLGDFNALSRCVSCTHQQSNVPL
jgi:endonuclease/exonuclease/phosphatase family metal-dependent hydrolase